MPLTSLWAVTPNRRGWWWFDNGRTHLLHLHTPEAPEGTIGFWAIAEPPAPDSAWQPRPTYPGWWWYRNENTGTANPICLHSVEIELSGTWLEAVPPPRRSTLAVCRPLTIALAACREAEDAARLLSNMEASPASDSAMRAAALGLTHRTIATARAACSLVETQVMRAAECPDYSRDEADALLRDTGRANLDEVRRDIDLILRCTGHKTLGDLTDAIRKQVRSLPVT